MKKTPGWPAIEAELFECTGTMYLMTASRAVAIAVVALALAGRAGAHHSFAAEYDAAKRITLTGTITRFDFVNPHAWLYIDVAGDDGKNTRWNVEMGSPNSLIRRGVNKTSVPVGATVVVQGYLARDGSSTISSTKVQLDNGRELFTGSDDSGAPPR